MGITGGTGLGASVGKIAVAGITSLLDSWSNGKDEIGMIEDCMKSVAISGAIQAGSSVFSNVTKTISNSKGLISLSVENATFNIMRNPTFKTAMIRYVSGYYKIIKDFILG